MKNSETDLRRQKLDVSKLISGNLKDLSEWIVPRFSGASANRVKENYLYHKHQHTGYEVLYILKGHYRCTLNAQEIALNPDEVLIVKPGDWHQDILVPHVYFFALGFFFDNLLDRQSSFALFEPGTGPRDQCVRADGSFFRPLINKIEREYAAHDWVSTHIQNTLLLEFFWLLLRSIPPAHVSRELLHQSFKGQFLSRLERLFQQHLLTDLPVPVMADALHMGERLLFHTCRTLLGQSPHTAFLQFKMEKAKTLLQNTSMSIKEISAYLGFNDPYQFSKAFKKVYRKSPLHLRQAALQE